ncbi:MAG TPA: DUF2335 domain-containing protein [Verrucomicrobiae bacterium]|nr:DUF2335 domain-containing protein [Verrucomicrobiae bacterium]
MASEIFGPTFQPVVSVQSHHGPIPAPETIAGYEKVLTGAANRIIAMAEREQGNRHKLERRGQILQTGLIFVGQLFAFALGLSGIAGGIYLVRNDKSLVGFGVFFASLASLIGIFIYNRNRKEPDQSPPKKSPSHSN